jgi:hypothetical protein
MFVSAPPGLVVTPVPVSRHSPFGILMHPPVSSIPFANVDDAVADEALNVEAVNPPAVDDVAVEEIVIFPPNIESPVTFNALVERPPVFVMSPPANVDVAVPEFLMIVETFNAVVNSPVETFSEVIVDVDAPDTVILPANTASPVVTANPLFDESPFANSPPLAHVEVAVPLYVKVVSARMFVPFNKVPVRVVPDTRVEER